MKTRILGIMLFVGITSLLFAQNVLVNGDFSDGTNGWTQYPTLDGSAAGIIDVVDDQAGPVHGNGPYLEMYCEGNSYFNQLFYSTDGELDVRIFSKCL